TGPPDLNASDYDLVLMLDVIEHLMGPELFLEQLRTKIAANPDLEVIISTGNIAFFVTRCMLLTGQFNYGKRGILDMTHTRLFTFASLRRALEQAGFDILETRGVPAPYPMAIGDNIASRAFLAVNRILMFISRGLFSYQIFMRVKAQPVVGQLLNRARDESHVRAGAMETTRCPMPKNISRRTAFC
ncbi:MAG: methyltransferase domain-containing protein, partial [Bryobacteraceae bacterium]